MPVKTSRAQIALRAASRSDAPVLENLLELYAHDLSAVFELKIGADGRYRYPRLPLYWTEPEQRFAFLIHSADEIVGFALVCRGSPISEDPRCHDMAEFFVLRPHRREGQGARAACLLWQRFPGPWTVRVAAANRGALAFWNKAIDAHTSNSFSRSEQVVGTRPWVHFAFGKAD